MGWAEPCVSIAVITLIMAKVELKACVPFMTSHPSESSCTLRVLRVFFVLTAMNYPRTSWNSHSRTAQVRSCRLTRMA